MEHNCRLSKAISMGVLIIVIICFGGKNVYAQDDLTITLVDLTLEEAERKYLSVSPRLVKQEILECNPIEQLIVADNWIAVGTTKKVVGVFDLDGRYRYSIAFTTDGRYYMYYDEETDGLMILVAQSSVYFTFDKNGTLIQMKGRDIERGEYKKTFQSYRK